jgi:integrase
MVDNNDNKSYGLGLAIVTVRSIREAMRTVFYYAMGEKLITENPVKRTTVPPAPLSTANPLTLEEVWAFLSVKDLFHYGDAFLFQLQTGLRPEELMALIWSDIDFIKGTLRIERACKWLNGSFKGLGKVKTKRSPRVIELAPEQLDFLKARLIKQNREIAEKQNAGEKYGEPNVQEWLSRERPKQRHLYGNTNLVFPNLEGRIPSSSVVRGCFKRMLRRAGFTGDRRKLRWYDLRHTHATYLLTLGVPDHEVAARLGHSVLMLNEMYAHVLPQRQRMASSLIVSLIPLNIKGTPAQEEILTRISKIAMKAKTDLEGALMYFFKKREDNPTLEHNLEHMESI